MSRETIIVSIEDLKRYLNGVDFASDFGLANWPEDERNRLISIIEQLQSEADGLALIGIETEDSADPELCSECMAIGGLCKDVLQTENPAERREKLDRIEDRLARYRTASAGQRASGADGRKAGGDYAGVTADDCGGPTSCLAVKIADLDDSGSGTSRQTPTGQLAGEAAKVGGASAASAHDAFSTPTGHLAEETVETSAAADLVKHKKDERGHFLAETADPYEIRRRDLGK